jgi:hypothetical protein
VTANLRTPAKDERAITTQSTIQYDDTYYTVPTTVDIDGLSLTPTMLGMVKDTQRMYELFHFGYVAQLDFFRGNMLFLDNFVSTKTLPHQLFFHPRFIASDCGHVKIFIKGCISQLCDETPTDLRMRSPPPTINFDGMTVTLTEAQRKAATDPLLYQHGQDAHKLED